LEQVDDLGLVDAVGDAAFARGDIAILQRRQDQAQGGGRALIARLHRRLQVIVEALPQHGNSNRGNDTNERRGDYRIRTTEAISGAASAASPKYLIILLF